MEGPPPEFFEALKFYPDALEEAVKLLKGQDPYSKSLLALILTRISVNNDTQVDQILSTIDTGGNDIAMMLCFMAYDHRSEYSKGNNLIFKRFGKEVKAEAVEAVAEEAVAEEADSKNNKPNDKPINPNNKPNEEPEEPKNNKPNKEPEEPKNNKPNDKSINPNQAVKPEEAVTSKLKQAGGSKKKRPSKLRKTKRASRA